MRHQRIAADLVAPHRSRIDRVARAVRASSKRKRGVASPKAIAHVERAFDGAVEKGVGERDGLATLDEPSWLVIRGQPDGARSRRRRGAGAGDSCQAGQQQNSYEESGHWFLRSSM